MNAHSGGKYKTDTLHCMQETLEKLRKIQLENNLEAFAHEKDVLLNFLFSMDDSLTVCNNLRGFGYRILF